MSSTATTSLTPEPDCQLGDIPGELYGSDFTLNTADYDGHIQNFTLVPCPYGRDCKNCGLRLQRLDAIFVALDDACRDNGREGARTSFGVFLGQNSKHNLSDIVRQETTHSNERAELYACIAGLGKVDDIFNPMYLLKKFQVETPFSMAKVIIKADSEYLVKRMTEWVRK